MTHCPNKSLPEWKDLVEARGESIAYYLWDKHQGEVPKSEYEVSGKQLRGDQKLLNSLDKLVRTNPKFANDYYGLRVYYDITGSIDDLINKGSNEELVALKNLVDKYELGLDNISLQKEPLPASKASPETLAKDREVIKKMGVNLQNLTEYIKGNPNVEAKGVNALTDLIHGIIAIAEGKEDVATTEEMVHVATAILEQKNPNLITEMINKIDRFAIYDQVRNTYKTDKNYQTKDGKPNIRKIKKEAVDKLITELIIKGNEGDTEFPDLLDETKKSIIRTWWNKILDWFRGQYKKANIDVFNEVANKVMNIDSSINELSIPKEGNGILLQKKAEEHTANEISESFKSKDNKNERKYNRSTSISKGFGLLQREGVDKYSDLLTLQRNTQNIGEMLKVGSESISYYKGVLGRSFKGIFSDEKRGIDMEGIARRYSNLRVIQSLNENKFLGDLARRLGVENIRVVTNKDVPNKSPLFTTRKDIYINEDEWVKSLEQKFKNGVNLDKYVDIAVFEELIHLVARNLYDEKQFLEAENELKGEDRLLIDKFYYDVNPQSSFSDKLDPFNRINELIRMKVQKDLVGRSTEDLTNTSFIDGIVHKIWDFIMNAFKTSLVKSNKIAEDVKQYILSDRKEEGKENENNKILGLPQIVSDAQKKVQQDILATNQNIEKVYEPGKADPMFQDTEEADNHYELKKADGTKERIKKRVTDRVKAWYKQRFPDKQFTPEEKAKNELKRKFGVKAHAFLEEIHGRYFNEDGTKRDVAGPRPSIDNEVDEQVYSKLERYFSKLVEDLYSDGKNPLIFSEKIIYDPKQKEAGTLDLLAIDEDGKVHIIDWKFLEVGKDRNDIAWFKQGAFNIQLGRYKDILKEAYGIKSFGLNRAIPFLLKIERENSKDIKSPFVIKGITTGNVDTSQIEDLRLVPVSEQTETTGNEKLDKIISELNATMKQIGKEQAITNEEREFKSERLNKLRQAIREIQGRGNIAPLIETIESLRKQGDNIIADWNLLYKDRPSSDADINDKALSNFADQMREYQDIANTFSGFSNALRRVLYDVDTKEDIVENGKEIADNIRDETDNIRESANDIKDIMNQFADKFIGQKNLVSGLLNPEAVLKGLKATFGNITELPLKSLEILSKMVTKATLSASRVVFDQVKELMAIRERFVKRGDVHKLVSQIYQKDDKGKLVNKLIYRYSKDFYDLLKANAEEGQRSKKVIKDNIDVEAYKKKAKEILEGRITRLNFMYKDDEDTRDDLILQEKRKWDIDRKDFNGWNNYLIDNYPLDKWHSEEYKNIQKDEDLLSLYNFIAKINEEARDAGYIDGAVRNTFLPFIRKTTAEALTWGMNPSIIGNWFDKLTISADDKGFGKRNELTGELEHSVPKYYTYDFTRKADGTHDYSEISEEIFKNMALYINHMQKYKNLKEIEGQIKLLKTVEEFKDHLKTNRLGDVGEPEVMKGNEKNVETLDKFIRASLYGEKYVSSDADIAVDVHPFNAVGKIINKVAGKEVFKVDEKPDPISLTKTMDALNSYFRVKTLGFNVVSGAAVYFGSNMQVLSQAGKYFKESEFLSNTLKLLKDKFTNNDERKMFLQLMDVFVPIRSDRIQSEIRKTGIGTLSRIDFNGVLMSVLTQPSEYVEKSIFMSLLNNMMIEDGKIVNITDFVNAKYKDRWESAVTHKEAVSKIKTEVEELKKTRSIDAIKKLDENGKLVIPGLDLSNTKEIDRLTNLTRSIARTSTHGRTSADINQFGMNVWTNSMQVFKTWIPKLMISRFQHFEKVGDDFNVTIDDNGHTDGERYDIGRFRLFMYVMSKNITGKATNIINLLSANEKGVETLNQMYEDFARDYKQRTGHDMNMNKEDFFDLIRTNLRNEVRELAVLFSLLGMLFATGYFAPQNDEDKAAKNAHNYYIRIMDKFVTQLSFFYNPVEFQKLLSGGMFPAIGMFDDISKFTHNMIMETTGFDITKPTLTPEEVYQKAQPIKYGMQLFPIGKAAITYMSMFDADFAKAFNVTISDKVQK